MVEGKSTNFLVKTQLRRNKKLAPSMLDKGEVYQDYKIRIKSNLYRHNFEFIEIFPIFSVRTLGVSPSLVSRWREVYSLWGT